MLLREFLPARTAEDVWAERIRVRLGGTEYPLAVLPMDANAEWKALVRKEAAQVFDALEGLDSLDAVMRLLADVETDLLLRLLLEYDRASARSQGAEPVLPPVEAIRATASEQSVLRAFLEVFSAANPTLAVTIDAVVRQPELLRALMGSTPRPSPSSGSRPSTDGPADGSGES